MQRSTDPCSLKKISQNEIILRRSLKSGPAFKEEPSLKTFDGDGFMRVSPFQCF